MLQFAGKRLADIARFLNMKALEGASLSDIDMPEIEKVKVPKGYQRTFLKRKGIPHLKRKGIMKTREGQKCLEF